MKPYLLLAPLVLLAACRPDDQPATTATPPPATSAPTAGAPAATPDTLHVADSLGRRVAVLPLRPSTAAAFQQLPAGPLPVRPTDNPNPAATADAPLPAGGRVQRQGQQLRLRPAQGPAVVLTPQPSPEDGPEGRDIAYYYWGSLPAAHQWVVDVVMDDGSSVLLVDQRTGRRTSLLGAPSLSPDGRHLLSMCEDVSSGGTPTNLSLYRCDGPAPQLVWSRNLTAWGPRAARWRDARHAILLRAHAATDPSADVAEAAQHVRLSYAELELPARP
ncbi:hypothetical protein Q5H93_06660 [Hymenobacter sp. ASUV-10]|uniref:Uncharacterized protein n=1 Tax=Hymenobacter aranciens TaxID=3063996 RepID=A0ABT9BCY6_9BACT|nr:hypothetical protein [Hymenobacter sp. ASUV-10]MDO7874408.1 hypothetical protein [Hymenobacter sp. ASUV-10]